MDLILVRHGQSQNNATQEGILNSPLTSLGHQQAESVGRAVAALKPEVIASGSLQRALQTAWATAEQVNLPIEVWNHAHEVRLKSGYDGLHIDEMYQRFPSAIFNEKNMVNDRWQHTSDNSLERARTRATTLLDNFWEKYLGKRVAVFLHGHLNRLIIQSILGPSTFGRIHIRQPNACINRFIFEDEHIHVHSISDVSHLTQDGIKIT